MTHTPLPWRFDEDWYRIPTIFGGDGKKVASVEKDCREATPERAANAAFIVRAVNSHDALVDALQLGRDAVLQTFETVKTTEDQHLADARLQAIDAALALAKGEASNRTTEK